MLRIWKLFCKPILEKLLKKLYNKDTVIYSEDVFLGKRFAMTIGELLVTMAIIGVIAMLVLPGFLKDYHKKLYAAKVKKAYEMVETAVNQACTDNNVSYFYQTPYTTGSKAVSQSFIDKYFKKANVQLTNPFSSSYKILNTGKSASAGLVSEYGWARLAGGEAVSFHCAGDSTNYCVFRVDINSLDGPNIGGRDYFAFFINIKTNKIYDNSSATVCGNDVYGYGCLARLMQDNWEMKY